MKRRNSGVVIAANASDCTAHCTFARRRIAVWPTVIGGTQGTLRRPTDRVFAHLARSAFDGSRVGLVLTLWAWQALRLTLGGLTMASCTIRGCCGSRV
eukprot:2898662-Prymnesium_polylepis.1